MNSPSAHQFILYQEPDFLTFNELAALYKNPEPKGVLKEKLAQFWQTPIISNEAYYRGLRPAENTNTRLGKYIRLASWNIEKSIMIKDAVQLLSSVEKAAEMFDHGKAPRRSLDHALVLYQRDRLASSDILLLQEMDIGVKRSGYVNAAREIAEALGMNYAYGAAQLEIDPIYLGLEKINDENRAEDRIAIDSLLVDPEKYKGVFGSAVLSRYPIKYAEVFQLNSQAYDWYRGEIKKTAVLEKARRFGSKTIFKNSLTREIKKGGRIYMRVDLDVPGLPEDTLTVINIHLEIKCLPVARERQMREILTYIKDIKNPVIMAGDFNSADTDLSPTSTPRLVKRSLKNPTLWASTAVTLLTPYGLIINSARFISNYTKNLHNPLVWDVPVVAPNDVKDLFSMIKNYRFSDGGAFDFRGNKQHSVNRKGGTLANSNQRDSKGFKTTFQLQRPFWFVAKFRLDWIFVKSFLQHPEDNNGPYRLAPHFGETLEEMNMSLKEPISDHHPNVVDIPLDEPSWGHGVTN